MQVRPDISLEPFQVICTEKKRFANKMMNLYLSSLLLSTTHKCYLGHVNKTAELDDTGDQSPVEHSVDSENHFLWHLANISEMVRLRCLQHTAISKLAMCLCPHR